MTPEKFLRPGYNSLVLIIMFLFLLSVSEIEKRKWRHKLFKSFANESSSQVYIQWFFRHFPRNRPPFPMESIFSNIPMKLLQIDAVLFLFHFLAGLADCSWGVNLTRGIEFYGGGDRKSRRASYEWWVIIYESQRMQLNLKMQLFLENTLAWVWTARTLMFM